MNNMTLDKVRACQTRDTNGNTTLTFAVLSLELDLAAGVVLGTLPPHDTQDAEEEEDAEDDDEADPDRFTQKPLSYRHVQHVVHRHVTERSCGVTPTTRVTDHVWRPISNNNNSNNILFMGPHLQQLQQQ